MDHVTDREVGDFLEGRLDAASRKRVMRHLLGTCGRCRLKFAAFFSEPASQESDYDAAVDRAVRSVLEDQRVFWITEEEHRERLAAALPARCEDLLRPSPALEKAGPHGWAWVEALLARSQEERFREPARMLDWALLALVAAQSLDLRAYGEALVADLQARSWVELANAFRVSEDFGSAEDALAQGREICERGTGDLLVLARVYDVEASLRTDQRRLGEALKLLDLLYRLYVRLGDTHLAGRALISKGINTAYAGQLHEAVVMLQNGLAQLSPERDPQLVGIAEYSLLYTLVDVGEFHEAGKLLLASGLREAFATEPLNLAKLRWLEGRIFAGLGRLARAEAVYQEARESFVRVACDYESALAGLDLASVWLRQGKTSQVRELAEDLVLTFEAVGVQSEALKAMRYLREACRRESATPALVETVGGFLRRLEWQPQLRFVP